MEVLLVGTIVGLGVLFSKTEKDNINKINKVKPVENMTNKNESTQKIDNFTLNNTNNKNLNNTNLEVSDNINDEVLNNCNDDKSFEHNNMVPFFGSNLRQNLNPLAGRTLFNYQNGSDDHYRQKRELKSFFQPEKNISNVYGFQNADVFLNDRFTVSSFKNNEKPMEPIRVGPGLNKGYTGLPSGGFHQGDSRDYILPKTTDEMRTVNNPKVSYEGRIVSGKRISKRGVSTDVHKRLPERFYKNEPNKYFTTTGDHLGHANYPAQLLKNTKEKQLLLKKELVLLHTLMVIKTLLDLN